MGYASYSSNSRSIRSESLGYTTKSVDQIFTQSAERKAHELMSSRNITLRESHDSEEHPETVPVQLYLDVTGSMGHVPHQMIKDGLPTLVGTLIESGIPDVALMFGAIGDHETDREPLQIAQFESGDEELDMWLTRSYLEGGGGGNGGESYLLAWYFAAFHTRTDAWDLRGKKGFVFTVGDEPNLKSLPVSAVNEVMGGNGHGQSTYSDSELLALAQKKNHVYHIFLEHGYRGGSDIDHWREVMGDNLIVVKDHTEIPKKIAELVLSHAGDLPEMPVIESKIEKSEDTTDADTSDEEEIIL